MANVIQRIEALLARAGDAGASEEEARTSAVIAARLIKKHGVQMKGGGLDGEAPGLATALADVRYYRAQAREWEQRAKVAEAEIKRRADVAETDAKAREVSRTVDHTPRKRQRRPVD